MTTYADPLAGTLYAASGILFQSFINPFGATGMPDCAVADLGNLPTTLGPGSSLSAWTTGWPDGGPQWVAEPTETFERFKTRVIADCKSQGIGGVVVNVWSRGGFWERNQNCQLLSGG